MTLETGVKALAEAVAVDVKALEDGKANSLHTHAISDVTELPRRLNSIDALIGDVESVLVAINGES